MKITMEGENSCLRREAAWHIPVAFYVGHLAFVTLVPRNLWLGSFVEWTESISGGLLNPILLNYLPMLILLIGGIVMIGGRLRTVDLGLRSRSFLPGILTCCLLWTIVQLGGVAYQVSTTGTARITAEWQRADTSVLIGYFLAQILGNALFEEIGYRGFLFSQLRLKGEHRLNPAAAIWAALAGSALLFALMHVPFLLSNGVPVERLFVRIGVLALAGVGFGLIYWRTRNLYFVIGAHALLNTPLPLFTPPRIAIPALLILILLTTWAWKHIPALSAKEQNTVKAEAD